MKFRNINYETIKIILIIFLFLNLNTINVSAFSNFLKQDALSNKGQDIKLKDDNNNKALFSLSPEELINKTDKMISTLKRNSNTEQKSNYDNIKKAKPNNNKDISDKHPEKNFNIKELTISDMGQNETENSNIISNFENSSSIPQNRNLYFNEETIPIRQVTSTSTYIEYKDNNVYRSYDAKNILSEEDFWCSSGNHGLLDEVEINIELDNNERFNSIYIFWAFAPGEYRIQYSNGEITDDSGRINNNTDSNYHNDISISKPSSSSIYNYIYYDMFKEKFKKTIKNSSSSWWNNVLLDQKRRWLYRSFDERVDFSDEIGPIFAKFIKITMRIPVNVYFGIYKISLYKFSYTQAILNNKAVGQDLCLGTISGSFEIINSSENNNFEKESNSSNLEKKSFLIGMDCTQLMDYGDNREVFKLNSNGYITTLSSERCLEVSDATDLIILNNCSEGDDYQDGRNKWNIDYKGTIISQKSRSSCLGLTLTQETLIPDYFSVQASSTRKDGVHEANNVKDMTNKNYWASEPESIEVYFQINFSISVVVKSLIINWKIPAKSFKLYGKYPLQYGSIEDIVESSNNNDSDIYNENISNRIKEDTSFSSYWVEFYSTTENTSMETTIELKSLNFFSLKISMIESSTKFNFQETSVNIYAINYIHIETGAHFASLFPCEETPNKYNRWEIKDIYYNETYGIKKLNTAKLQFLNNRQIMENFKEKINLFSSLILLLESSSADLKEKLNHVGRDISQIKNSIGEYQDYLPKNTNIDLLSLGSDINLSGLSCGYIKNSSETKRTGFYYIKNPCMNEALRFYCVFPKDKSYYNNSLNKNYQINSYFKNKNASEGELFTCNQEKSVNNYATNDIYDFEDDYRELYMNNNGLSEGSVLEEVLSVETLRKNCAKIGLEAFSINKFNYSDLVNLLKVKRRYLSVLSVLDKTEMNVPIAVDYECYLKNSKKDADNAMNTNASKRLHNSKNKNSKTHKTTINDLFDKGKRLNKLFRLKRNLEEILLLNNRDSKDDDCLLSSIKSLEKSASFSSFEDTDAKCKFSTGLLNMSLDINKSADETNDSSSCVLFVNLNNMKLFVSNFAKTKVHYTICSSNRTRLVDLETPPFSLTCSDNVPTLLGKLKSNKTSVNNNDSQDSNSEVIKSLINVSCPDKCGEEIQFKIYGTNVYTENSSICRAAIHKGIIKNLEGGIFAIKIESGKDSYSGSFNFNIESLSYDGLFFRSFSFEEYKPSCPIDNFTEAKFLESGYHLTKTSKGSSKINFKADKNNSINKGNINNYDEDTDDSRIQQYRKSSLNTKSNKNYTSFLEFSNNNTENDVQIEEALLSLLLKAKKSLKKNEMIFKDKDDNETENLLSKIKTNYNNEIEEKIKSSTENNNMSNLNIDTSTNAVKGDNLNSVKNISDHKTELEKLKEQSRLIDSDDTNKNTEEINSIENNLNDNSEEENEKDSSLTRSLDLDGNNDKVNNQVVGDHISIKNQKINFLNKQEIAELEKKESENKSNTLQPTYSDTVLSYKTTTEQSLNYIRNKITQYKNIILSTLKSSFSLKQKIGEMNSQLSNLSQTRELGVSNQFTSFKLLKEYFNLIKKIYFKIDRNIDFTLKSQSHILSESKRNNKKINLYNNFVEDYINFNPKDNTSKAILNNYFIYNSKNTSSGTAIWNYFEYHLNGHNNVIQHTGPFYDNITGSHLVIDERDFYDFEFKASVYVPQDSNSSGSSSTSNVVFGVCFRYQSPYDYLTFEMSVDSSNGFKKLRKIIHGKPFLIEEKNDGGFIFDSWMNIKIVGIKNRIKVYYAAKTDQNADLNANDYILIFDKLEESFPHGTVAFSALGISRLLLDNISVIHLPCSVDTYNQGKFPIRTNTCSRYIENFKNIETKYMAIDPLETTTNKNIDSPSNWDIEYNFLSKKRVIAQKSTIRSSKSSQEGSLFVLNDSSKICNTGEVFFEFILPFKNSQSLFTYNNYNNKDSINFSKKPSDTSNILNQDITSDPDVDNDSNISNTIHEVGEMKVTSFIGIVFKYQNENNHYSLEFSHSFIRIRKKTSSTEYSIIALKEIDSIPGYLQAIKEGQWVKVLLTMKSNSFNVFLIALTRYKPNINRDNNDKDSDESNGSNESNRDINSRVNFSRNQNTYINSSFSQQILDNKDMFIKNNIIKVFDNDIEDSEFFSGQFGFITYNSLGYFTNFIIGTDISSTLGLDYLSNNVKKNKYIIGQELDKKLKAISNNVRNSINKEDRKSYKWKSCLKYKYRNQKKTYCQLKYFEKKQLDYCIVSYLNF